MPLRDRFSPPSIHHAVYADDFWPAAASLRRALLAHPDWGPMLQYSRGHAASIHPDRQSGIAGRNLEGADTAVGREIARVREFLTVHAVELCATVGVEAAADTDFRIQCNAMSYGEGTQLVPHTDFRDDEARPHVLAWILYLTDPADDEWDAAKGGALRLIDGTGPGVRVYPKFNRFAMFRVSDESLHEVEAVTWPCPWERSRLALSGWIRGPVDPTPRHTLVYRRSPTADAEREKHDRWLRGAIAMHRLWQSQQAFAGIDTADTAAKILVYEREAAANRQAPSGTVFVRTARGPAGCIIVFDDADRVLYFGPASGYSAGG